MEEKIIKILELVQTKDDGTVEFSEESKKLIHEVAEKCRILPIYQQNKEKVNTYKDGMTAKGNYILPEKLSPCTEVHSNICI